MAVVYAKEHWPNRSGSFGTISESVLVRHWVVKTNNKLDDPFSIKEHFRNSMGITLYTPHPNPDASAFTMRSLDVNPKTETPIAWDVTATYSPAPIDDDSNDQQNPNPLLRPRTVDWESEDAEEFTIRGYPVDDDTGDLGDLEVMLNSAGDPLEAIERDDNRWIIVVSKNFENLPTWVGQYTNSVNSSSIVVNGVTCARRTLKFNRLRVPQEFNENGQLFLRVTAEFGYKPQTWDVFRLDEGFNELIRPEAAQVTKILLPDENGELREPTEPVMLDGNGNRQADPGPDTAVVLRYSLYPEKDFTQLPF